MRSSRLALALALALVSPLAHAGEHALLSAYCPCPLCCGEWSDGITANGARAVEGVTIACPPQLPFGAVLDIEGLGQRWCEDRGSAITAVEMDGTVLAWRIDVFMETHEAALEFGRRVAKVRILHGGGDDGNE